ncbi:hypothetical protein GGD38_004338 [Chitinophagaceae bacterium OAS944]|nr:hypothetical protein [Chitinophagaceae bacterium OAS944]
MTTIIPESIHKNVFLFKFRLVFNTITPKPVLSVKCLITGPFMYAKELIPTYFQLSP